LAVVSIWITSVSCSSASLTSFTVHFPAATISREGMMRGHCNFAVTTVLSPGEDVMDVEVIPEPGQAKVNYYPEKIDVKDLKRVIVKSSYKA